MERVSMSQINVNGRRSGTVTFLVMRVYLSNILSPIQLLFTQDIVHQCRFCLHNIPLTIQLLLKQCPFHLSSVLSYKNPFICRFRSAISRGRHSQGRPFPAWEWQPLGMAAPGNGGLIPCKGGSREAQLQSPEDQEETEQLLRWVSFRWRRLMIRWVRVGVFEEMTF